MRVRSRGWLDRLLRSGLGLLGVTAIVVACGSSEAPRSPTTPGNVPATPNIWHINGAISENHGHKVTLSWAQIERVSTVAIPFHGNPSHSHLVTVSSAELRRIADGERVVTMCAPGGEHTHVVMFSWPDNLEKGTPLKDGRRLRAPE